MRMPRITAIDRLLLNVPFTPRCEEWNAPLVHQWHIPEIVRVRTEDPEVVGYGESMYHYTSGNARPEAMARLIGENPAGWLNEDGIGLDLQMALYDVVGKALELPVYRLLPLPKVREWCPLGWWNIDMPPEVLAEEAADAYAQGYRAHKIKARPWFDVYEQVRHVSAATGPSYKIDIDWNDMLLSAGNAAPVLQELDTFEKVALYEGPIPQRDIEGYAELRRKVAKPLVTHFGLPPFPTALQNRMCDGFVVFGGVQEVIRQGMLCATFEKPFFLQQVGLGLTTAMVAHLGAVLIQARWPAITCMNNYADDLLVEPLTIRHGAVRVPEAPGLGVTVDEEALEKYRVDPDSTGGYRLPEPRHLLTVRWADGKQVHYAHANTPKPAGTAPYSHLAYGAGSHAEAGRQLWEDFLAGNHPVQERGVTLIVRKDDGTDEWASLYARAERGPVSEG
ncbi:MAG: mandelate racemase/muconate lactonizing enzyme family protein [Capsulimonadales bacterium]|nr:mandelate racemase/muconate lactonizing enzyme family protein [Capsulimonadales bacterium]